MIRLGRIEHIGEASGVAPVRRAAIDCAGALRMNQTAAGRAALVVTELATNLVKHAGEGSMLFGSDDDAPAFIVVAIDRGGGIANLGVAMSDGFSTAGSPGTGMGALSRVADALDVYSGERGTAVLCRVGAAPRERPRDGLTVAGLSVPKPGQSVGGDAWSAAHGDASLTIVVADGLGHGEDAALASSAAIRSASEAPEASLEELMKSAHGALRSTRGAALGMARIHAPNRRVEFAGVGNIAGAVVDDDGVRHVVSHAGIVGHEMRKVRSFSYPWSSSAVLLLHSDGVSASWNISNYPGLMQHDPALIAAVLYRDHGRGTDDATVVVAKTS